ncbi:MAG: nucleotidyltransferase domain-containing protein [Acidobacteriota bacterium]
MATPHRRTDDLDEVRCVVSSLLRGRRVRIFLFGSLARGTARTTSDIDLAVLPLEPLPPGLLATLREAIEESASVRRVDVVDLSAAPAALRIEVEREGVEWTL